MHRPGGAPLVDATLQPGLGLEAGSIDPGSETALRAVYERQPWKTRHSFAEALASPGLHTLLRVLAEIAARKARL